MSPIPLIGSISGPKVGALKKSGSFQAGEVCLICLQGIDLDSGSADGPSWAKQTYF
jgi:hypothetical protein